MFGIGMPELIIIFVIALLVFGPKELPKIGRTIGKAMAEFRRASDELREGIQRDIDLAEREEQEAEPVPAPATTATATPPGAAEAPVPSQEDQPGQATAHDLAAVNVASASPEPLESAAPTETSKQVPPVGELAPPPAVPPAESRNA